MEKKVVLLAVVCLLTVMAGCSSYRKTNTPTPAPVTSQNQQIATSQTNTTITPAPQKQASKTVPTTEAAVVIWELNKLLEVGTDSANVNTITLNLVPQNGSPGMQAVPPIIGTTSLTLPLYPDAISTSQEFSMPFEETPGSWYVRVAKADYITSTGLTNLEAWYVQHMNDLGFQQAGGATTGNLKTGVSTQGVIFKPNQQPQGHSIEVDLSFQYFSKGQTLLEYWVTDLVVPPRPATNFIPGDVAEIDGSITVYGTKVTQLKVHITDITKIQSLVSASNSLNQVIQGVNPGGPMIWGTAELVFHTSAGEEIPVDIDTDSVSVNGVGLQDYGGTVWKVLASIYGINGPN
jgi:outer membrane murein-binding lipoprotein Lpp